jgi:nitronate monooxygenase
LSSSLDGQVSRQAISSRLSLGDDAMSISTRLTEKLHIRHPIMLAPMDMVADAKLACAVSGAGGFGMIGGGYGEEKWLMKQLDEAGDERVGIGFITWSLAKNPRLLDLVLERRPPAVMLSFGEVAPFAQRIKQADALLVCQVQTLAQAREAAGQGADIIVAQGAEAGGHGVARGLFPFVPAVVDAAPEIVVVAAGGVADGRGLAAALMLGAEGVLMGTRLYASREAAAPSEAKQRVAQASGDSTIRGLIFDIARKNVWPRPFTGRVLCNQFSEEWVGREDELLRRQEEVAAKYREAREKGDFEVAAVIAGEAVDLIHDIPAASEIIERMVSEASELLSRAPLRYGLGARPK